MTESHVYVQQATVEELAFAETTYVEVPAAAARVVLAACWCCKESYILIVSTANSDKSCKIWQFCFIANTERPKNVIIERLL